MLSISSSYLRLFLLVTANINFSTCKLKPFPANVGILHRSENIRFLVFEGVENKKIDQKYPEVSRVSANCAVNAMIIDLF